MRRSHCYELIKLGFGGSLFETLSSRRYVFFFVVMLGYGAICLTYTL